MVDHDHATGAIRGIVCNNCNMALGLVDDSVERLEDLIGYLRRSATTTKGVAG
jgi:hypothetical protein